jgi:hypothetical protein
MREEPIGPELTTSMVGRYESKKVSSAKRVAMDDFPGMN